MCLNSLQFLSIHICCGRRRSLYLWREIQVAREILAIIPSAVQLVSHYVAFFGAHFIYVNFYIYILILVREHEDDEEPDMTGDSIHNVATNQRIRECAIVNLIST